MQPMKECRLQRIESRAEEGRGGLKIAMEAAGNVQMIGWMDGVVCVCVYLGRGLSQTSPVCRDKHKEGP